MRRGLWRADFDGELVHGLFVDVYGGEAVEERSRRDVELLSGREFNETRMRVWTEIVVPSEVHDGDTCDGGDVEQVVLRLYDPANGLGE